MTPEEALGLTISAHRSGEPITEHVERAHATLRTALDELERLWEIEHIAREYLREFYTPVPDLNLRVALRGRLHRALEPTDG